MGPPHHDFSLPTRTKFVRVSAAIIKYIEEAVHGWQTHLGAAEAKARKVDVGRLGLGFYWLEHHAQLGATALHNGWSMAFWRGMQLLQFHAPRHYFDECLVADAGPCDSFRT